MIIERFNAPLLYPQQCEALSEDIMAVTGQRLGVTTLKRMMGFIKGAETPRRASLDIIAAYLGFPDFSKLSDFIGHDIDISDFAVIDSLTSDDLERGERVRLTYDPGRVLVIEYLGESIFEVKESVGSKLMVGDKLIIAGFYVGFNLLITDIERQGRHLGAYRAAKRGGLTSVEII
ncbi:MAG: hypothetical protein K2K82_03615 [Muribaculaceae bacterium]|nr:hypothetical protein [Muribaculaceae bacterium]